MLDEDFHGHFCLDERLPTSATLYDMYYMLEMKRDKNVTETYKKKIPSEMEVAPRYNCWHC